ncbi:hypothetical protein HYC85_025610 [Camellia sinensis]|uniref:3-beta hydroxysteroid dehydrogenase/isomerase domain-containing protein n=1 Tax=Camellia sinensis TaxID=4442 RepID=A0A7J7GFD1_CAMSI|nr:hypothetical protein HYC85_025610 [Camellia sinensis]
MIHILPLKLKEALVIKSNDSNGLLTCCIRLSSIFGPGDELLVPLLVSATRAGKSKVTQFFVHVISHVVTALHIF